MINVLMADDHAIIRKGVKQLLALTDDIDVVAEAANGQQVLDQLAGSNFDLLLLDLNMPDTQGVTLIEKIRGLYGRLPILVLSMHEEAHIAAMALRAGASGYLSKDCDPSQLPVAIRKVAGGGRCIDDKMAMKVSCDTRSAAPEATPRIMPQALSEREAAILRLLAEGNSLKEIANSLSIERGTVSTYKTRMMKKMGFRNNVELMRYAISLGC